MQFLAKSVVIMAVRRKGRRGRRRNRRTPSKRKLFVPAVYSDFNTELDKSRAILQRFEIARGRLNLADPDMADNSPNKENHGNCEFSYSHWWKSTPVRRTQKLVRPPYTPVAPNNSTQYIISDHDFRVPRADFSRQTDTCETKVGLYKDVNCETCGVVITRRCDFAVRLADSVTCVSPEYNSKTAESEESSPSRAEVNSDCKSGHQLLETDSDYESPDDIDYFSFVQNDFLDMYEQVKTETLLRLSKTDLISKIISMERRLDALNKIEPQPSD